MSTPALIGILNEDGSMDYIYCHNDGYPAYMGRTLQWYYSDRYRVRDLIRGGDISCLRSKLIPDAAKVHTFDDPQDDVTIFYHRDRGEDWMDCRPAKVQDVGDFSFVGPGYFYLYDDAARRWTLIAEDKAQIPLAEIVDTWDVKE